MAKSPDKSSTSNASTRRATLRDQVHIRSHELAEIAGRGEREITQGDYEQAKRDLTGEVDLDRQNAALDREVRRPKRAK